MLVSLSVRPISVSNTTSENGSGDSSAFSVQNGQVKFLFSARVCVPLEERRVMCTSVSCSTGFVSYPDLCCYLSGTDEDMDEGTLMTQWFQLVNEKNELISFLTFDR